MALRPAYPLPQRRPLPPAASRAFIADWYRTAYDLEIYQDNPLAHWKVGEPSGTTAFDRMGINHAVWAGSNVALGTTGLVQGNNGDTAATLTRVNNSLGGWADVPGAGNLASAGVANTHTVEAWIAPTTVTAGSNQNVFSTSTFGIGIDVAGKVLFFHVVGGSAVTLLSTTTLTAGQTYHLLCTIVGGARTIYINGVSRGTDSIGTVDTPAASGGSYASIGRYPGFGDPYGGVVDEVAVYGTALTVTRAAAHYTAGTPSGASFNRSATDSIDLAETLTRSVSLPRAITESVTLAESLTRAASHPRAITETITIAESLARAAAIPRAVTESITIGESLARTAAHPRAITESITLAESLGRIVSDSRFPADGIALSDSAAGAANPGRLASDSIVLTDSLTRGAFTPARAATDNATLSDAVTRTSLRNRAATDSVTLSDVATGTVSAGGPQSRSATDSLILADTATRQLGEARSVSDSLVLSDAAAWTPPPAPGSTGSYLPLLFVGRSYTITPPYPDNALYADTPLSGGTGLIASGLAPPGGPLLADTVLLSSGTLIETGLP